MERKNLNKNQDLLRERLEEREQQNRDQNARIHNDGQQRSYCVFCGKIRSQQEINANDCTKCGFATGPWDNGVGHHRFNGKTQLPKFNPDGTRL